jgi:Xaa-Pro aminopeptidase
VDPTVITAEGARKLSERIKKKGGKKLQPVKENLIDLVWASEKPPRPVNKIIVLDVKYTGKKFEDKLEDLRKELEKKKSPALVLSMLDEIAWLFNLRGSDIDYNPVFFAYAIVTPTDATLFIDEDKLTPEVRAHLGNAVKIKPYNAVYDDLEVLNSTFLRYNQEVIENKGPTKKYLISKSSSWALSEGLGGDGHVEEIRSPVGDAKAIKNETELEGMRQCHIRDGAALSEYFAWLEDQLIAKGAKLDEVEAATKLEQIRSYVLNSLHVSELIVCRKHKNFVGLSFDTISSTGPNAAIIHYSPKPGSCSVIDPNAIYLCDSGAQFYDGTTDTTRTLHFGPHPPTKAEREAYTLVLKGHIGIALAKFPPRTSGLALDALARQHLWEAGLDYRHGTGHGVGSFLNVHEGPIGIGTRMSYADVPLSVGHVISNEPGYYEDGSYGIRIENVVMVKEVQTKYKFGDKSYLGFETVTMVPMCRKLVDMELLTEKETKWLNEYHKEVYEKTKGYFENDELTLKWLKRETAPY